MSRVARSRSKATQKRQSPRAAYTGETQRISTSEELAAVIRSAFAGTASGASVTADSAMRVAAVYACVRVLAESVAMLPLRLYRETGETSTLYPSDPLDKLVRLRPNPVHTPFDFKRLLVRSLLLRGNFYALKVGFNIPTGRMLVPLHPDRMAVEVDEARMSVRYRYRGAAGGETVFSPAQILHVRGIGGDGYVGQSVISAAAESIGLAITAEKHGAKTLSNGARPGGVLRHPQQLSEAAAKRLRESFDEKFGGADNAGRTLLLEEGLTFDKISMTSAEAQFIENRKFQRAEIAMFFGVPPHMIGDIERGTSWGSGIEQQGLGFVTYTLLPWLTNIAQAFERDLIPEQQQDGLAFRFVTDELTRADFLTRQNGRKVQLDAGVLSPNEWRRLEGLNPRKDAGGDSYRTGGEAPASTVPPAREPAAPPNPAATIRKAA